MTPVGYKATYPVRSLYGRTAYSGLDATFVIAPKRSSPTYWAALAPP